MSGQQVDIIFRGTPYEFSGFAQGFMAEIPRQYRDGTLGISCYTLETRDREENISPIPKAKFTSPSTLPKLFEIEERKDQARKRVVAEQQMVTPNQHSSFVYLRFGLYPHNTNFATFTPDWGWITAQILPNDKSKLIFTYNTQDAFLVSIGKSAYDKLEREGWIYTSAIAQQDDLLNKVPKGWLREAIPLWQQGYTAPQIGERFGKAARTVTNRMSDLRKILGEEFIPRHRK